MQDAISVCFRQVIGELSHFPSIRRIAALASAALKEAPPDEASRDSAVWKLILKIAIGEERLFKLWKHGFYCGKICEMIAVRAGLPSNLAFCSGLLHDIGKVVLCLSNPAAFHRAVELFEHYEGRISTSFAEKQALGIDHGEIGAAVAAECGIREDLCNVIRAHHAPRSLKPSKSVALMAETVYIADIISWNVGYPSVNGKNPYAVKDPMISIHESRLRSLGMDKNAFQNLTQEAGRVIAKNEWLVRKIV